MVQPQHMILSMDITDECEEQQERVDQKSIHSSSSGLAKCIKKTLFVVQMGELHPWINLKGNLHFLVRESLVGN